MRRALPNCTGRTLATPCWPYHRQPGKVTERQGRARCRSPGRRRREPLRGPRSPALHPEPSRPHETVQRPIVSVAGGCGHLGPPLSASSSASVPTGSAGTAAHRAPSPARQDRPSTSGDNPTDGGGGSKPPGGFSSLPLRGSSRNKKTRPLAPPLRCGPFRGAAAAPACSGVAIARGTVPRARWRAR